SRAFLQESARPAEHAAEHRPRELAGEGVLLARVVGGDQRDAIGEGRHGAVRGGGGARWPGRAEPAAGTQVRLPADPPEPHDDAHAIQQPERLEKVRLAARELGRRRLVAGRRAAERGGDVRVSEAETVSPMSRGRRVGEARVVERVDVPVAAPVAREHPAGAVAAVRRGCEPDEEEARLRVAEARQRPRPVGEARIPARRRRRDGSALGAVERAVRALEDHPRFNAGRGSVLTSAGTVETDASIMEGDRLQCGAVAAVSRIANPVTLARRVMEASRHILLVGEGALAFARAQGLPECDPEALVTERQRVRHRELVAATKGTVGAVALDRHGTIAAATSTGGLAGKLPGRVGDSALIGCGTYAESSTGGVSCTG